MGKIKNLMKIPSSIALVVLFLLSCSDERSIIVDGPTKIYSDYPASGMPEKDKMFAILNKGETAKIIQIKYSKDFKFYKIRLKDGREGYVQFGDNFKVVE